MQHLQQALPCTCTMDKGILGALCSTLALLPGHTCIMDNLTTEYLASSTIVQLAVVSQSLSLYTSLRSKTEIPGG